jgi:hypothetical protein
MWMKQTYKGLASGMIYAQKGDQVKVIRVEDQLTFVEFEGQKFHVQNSILSDKPIEVAKEISEPLPVFQKSS